MLDLLDFILAVDPRIFLYHDEKAPKEGYEATKKAWKKLEEEK